MACSRRACGGRVRQGKGKKRSCQAVRCGSREGGWQHIDLLHGSMLWPACPKACQALHTTALQHAASLQHHASCWGPAHSDRSALAPLHMCDAAAGFGYTDPGIELRHRQTFAFNTYQTKLRRVSPSWAASAWPCTCSAGWSLLQRGCCACPSLPCLEGCAGDLPFYKGPAQLPVQMCSDLEKAAAGGCGARCQLKLRHTVSLHAHGARMANHTEGAAGLASLLRSAAEYAARSSPLEQLVHGVVV